jgi:hypothetical protein
MKCILILCSLLLTLSSTKSQNVSNESVKANLIQTWKLSYVDDEGVRIIAKPEAPVITYEFYANSTLAFYDGKKPSEKTMGKWSYNEVKRNIEVKINDRSIGLIISLSSDAMTFVMEFSKIPSSNDKTQMVFVPSSDSAKENLKIDSNSKQFIKPTESTLLIESKIYKVGVYINPDIWQLTKANQIEPGAEYYFITKSDDGLASLSYENVVANLAEIPQIALNNLKKSCPDGEVVYSEYRVVNNTKILYMGMRGTLVGHKLIFLRYYYANEKGVFRLSAYTNEAHWNNSRNELQHLLDGLVILNN